MDAEHLADVFAAGLAKSGTRAVFGLPGGGNNLEVVGAVQRVGLPFVLAHSETAAAVMAAVHADLTGAPSAVVVTRGPGAASAVNGAAQALLDRQAILVLSDSVAAQERSRVTHQYLDQRAMFRPVTKASADLGRHEPERVMTEALALATRHPRGPVHLDFDPSSTEPAEFPTYDVGEITPDGLAAGRDLLLRARHPVVLLGVGARDVVTPVRKLLAGSHVPVLLTYRAKGVIPDSWANCAGVLTGATVESAVLARADAILAIGVDAVELIPAPWPYAAPVVSISSWVDDSAYLAPAVDVVGDLDQLVTEMSGSLDNDWPAGSGQQLRQQGIANLVDHEDRVLGISAQQLVSRVRALAPAGTIATVDAGAHMLAVLPLWETQERDEVIVSSGLATMGFALPAAIGAALARPGCRVVCFVGDGGLGMVLAELETLVRLDLPVTVVVFNDSRLSLIAVKQVSERHGGESAVAYRDIKFDLLAEGFGIPGRAVSNVADLDGAIAASLAATGPSLLDTRVDPGCYPGVLDAIRGTQHRAASESPESTAARPRDVA
jgi:acetolactate synthase-1/2/3 large subunit